MTFLPRWVLAAREARSRANDTPWSVVKDEISGQYSRVVDSNGLGVAIDLFDADAQFIAQAPQTQERLERALERVLEALDKASCDCNYFVQSNQICSNCQLIEETLAAVEKLGDSK